MKILSLITHPHVSWYCHECTSKSDMAENKLLEKAVIFVFFAHKKSILVAS